MLTVASLATAACKPQDCNGTHFSPSYVQEPSIDVPVRNNVHFEWENPRATPPQLDFDNAAAAYANHSNAAIIRSLAVFSLCSIQPLVKWADTVLRRMKMVLGKDFVNGIVKRTFFRHFCAGACHRISCSDVCWASAKFQAVFAHALGLSCFSAVSIWHSQLRPLLRRCRRRRRGNQTDAARAVRKRHRRDSGLCRRGRRGVRERPRLARAAQ